MKADSLPHPYDILLTLLRAALNSKDGKCQLDWKQRKLNHVQMDVLLKLAKEQALVGLIAQAILDSGVQLEPEDKLTLYGLQRNIRQANDEKNAAVVKLCREMQEEGIPIFVFKGQTIATYYPDSGLRQSGDIDFFCDKEYTSKATTYFEQVWKVDIHDDSTDKDESFQHDGIHYEMHHLMSAFGYPPHRRYWREKVMADINRDIHTVNIQGVQVPTLSPLHNALYVFIHIFHHLLSEGIGLRQFCDWYCVLASSHFTEADILQLKRHLEGIGLLKAYSRMGAVLTDYLGLPESNFPLPISDADHRHVATLFSNIIENGNLGHNKEYVQARGILHGLQHIWIIGGQAMRFYNYAPAEALWAIPELFRWWSVKLSRRMHKAISRR